MNHKTLLSTGLGLVFVALLGAGLALAGAVQVSSPDVSLGPPGTVFRYEQTFGETGVPYLIDTDHLNWPEGIGINADGTIWIAEPNGQRVLKYSGDGEFLMSIGTPGLTYLADETHFAHPTDVTVDDAGNFWVADWNSHRVIKYDPDGNYLNQLGITWEGGDDNAHFNLPVSLALDSTGHIYVSEMGNHRIQVFDSSGVYSTTIGQTGNPGGGNDQFDVPLWIAIDDTDNLYVADSQNHRVQIFDASHAYVATLGVTGVPGSDDSHFDAPGSVAVDSSFIYVSDINNHRVQIFDRAAPYTYQDTLGAWGSGDYEFDHPREVALDTDGNLYVADPDNFRVQKYDSNLVYVRTFGTTGVPYLTDGYHYNQPFDVAVDGDGNIAIVEDWGKGQRLIMLDAGGAPLFTIGEAGMAGGDNEHFSDPRGVAFDAGGNVYVADCANHRVQIFSSAGVYSTTLGSYGQGDDQFDCPSGVALDGSGNLYVADSGNQRIQIFDSSLVYSDTLGETGVPGDDDAHFNWPQDVEVDAAGNIYVADLFNHRVQKFDSNLDWQMRLGVTGECGYDFDHLCEPYGVAVDASGNIYVAEKFGPRVQVFDASGAYLTTIGGAWGTRSGQLRIPIGVDVDDQGNVYIADLENHRVQKFAPGVPDWQQVNINGFGDKYNYEQTRLAVFGDYLYASTANDVTGGEVWRSADGQGWTQVSPDGFGDPANRWFNVEGNLDGYLYVGVDNSVVGGELWRCSTCDGADWERVASAGFGDSNNTRLERVIPFSGALYATINNVITGAEVWKSTSGDPGTWTQSNLDGFGDPQNTGAWAAGLFEGYLYIATAQFGPPYDSGTYTGVEVWRTNDGVQWSQVNVDGFGEPDNFGGAVLAFEDSLYVGTLNIAYGAQVWRCSICDGADWERVVEAGFGNADNRGMGLTEFGGQLYATIENWTTGLEIWRTANGTDWQVVDASSLGDSNNAKSWSGAVFDHHLFLGTRNGANGGELWRYEAISTLTATTLSSALNPSKAGQPVTFTATITTTADIIPTGVVTFREDSTELGAAEVDETGAAAFTTADLEVGDHTVSAEYGGDAIFSASASEPLVQSVQYLSVYIPVIQR